MDFILPVSAGMVGVAIIVGILIHFFSKTWAMLMGASTRGNLDE